MSFTTLSRRVVEAGAAIKEGGGAAETAMAPFTRLGLSQKDVIEGLQESRTFLPGSLTPSVTRRVAPSARHPPSSCSGAATRRSCRCSPMAPRG